MKMKFKPSCFGRWLFISHYNRENGIVNLWRTNLKKLSVQRAMMRGGGAAKKEETAHRKMDQHLPTTARE
jgi:hypothetical protein